MSKPADRSSIGYGAAVLQQQGQALSQLAATLDDSFEHAIRLILDMPKDARIVTSGVGKAGIVATKISATFASVGFPSFFLHPSEALHGDLGRYGEGDLALLLSKSGETAELVRLLPHVKRLGCPVISITCSAHNTLAAHSDVVLTLGQVTECGPLGLAPTTSTTLMLALGDALAMAALEQVGLSREKFAALHPGGSLGHSLTLVEQVMRTGDQLCIVPQQLAVREVLHRITLTKGRPGAAAVIDATGVLVGVFTDGDLRRCLEASTDFLAHPVSEVMGRNPKTIHPSQLLEEAARLMTQMHVDQLIVVDDTQRPIGLVDIQDVVTIPG